MSTSLQELLKLAGIVLSDPKATRPRRVGDAAPLGGDQPHPTPSDTVPLGGDQPTTAPPVPALAQPPPRPMPVIDPAATMRTRYAGPDADAANAHLDRVQSFAGGEPFEPGRERRTQPQDYVADDLQYARDIERKPRNKVLDILTGITQGIASLEGNQPKQPWNFGGRERKLQEIYGRVGKELGVQKEQAQIKNLGALGDYRQKGVVGAQQKRMIDLYKSLPKYTKGENAAIDQMFEAAGLEFGNKDPKTAKPGARHYFKMNGQEMILEPGSSEAYAATGQGGAELYDPTQRPVEATGAVSGTTYTVKPGTALGAEAQQFGQGATQGRFEDSEARQANQFATQEFHRKASEARDVAQQWQKAYDETRELKAVVDALIAKRDANNGILYGEDAKAAVNLPAWSKMVETGQQRAQSLMDELHQRHGDFYYIDGSGLHAKNPQPPAAVAPQPSAPSGARPKVNHAKFEKDYAAATTPEERAKIMKLYQSALQTAGQQ